MDHFAWFRFYLEMYYYFYKRNLLTKYCTIKRLPRGLTIYVRAQYTVTTSCSDIACLEGLVQIDQPMARASININVNLSFSAKRTLTPMTSKSSSFVCSANIVELGL